MATRVYARYCFTWDHLVDKREQINRTGGRDRGKEETSDMVVARLPTCGCSGHKLRVNYALGASVTTGCGRIF